MRLRADALIWARETTNEMDDVMAIALITGSTRGIGRASAAALARAGHTVIVTGRTAPAVDHACASLASIGAEVVGIQVDVSDDDSVARLADDVRCRFDRLDILVNNAGILPEATDERAPHFASVDMFRRTFATNVFGVIAVTEALLPLLLASDAGRIVNVSSTVGSLEAQSNPESPWYSMLVPAYQSSKAALNSVTIELAKKLTETPIVVSSVCPGWVQTSLAPGNLEHAPLTAEDAADIVLAAATLPASARSGRFFDANGSVAW